MSQRHVKMFRLLQSIFPLGVYNQDIYKALFISSQAPTVPVSVEWKTFRRVPVIINLSEFLAFFFSDVTKVMFNIKTLKVEGKNLVCVGPYRHLSRCLEGACMFPYYFQALILAVHPWLQI
jgi:hypothetical protein